MSLRRESEYWHFLKSLFRTVIRLLWGMWQLTKLPQPSITIFGSARTQPSSLICKQARQLAKILAGEGFSIITGGGPGIMNAASQGAIDYLKEKHLFEFLEGKDIITAGIGLIRLNVGTESIFVQEHIKMDHFFARKWLLVRYSVGFIIFPGGFGTMDELAEIITLVQCNRMAHIPIILMGKDYWMPLLDWIRNYTLKNDFIGKKDMTIATVVDDVEEAASIIIKKCRGTKQSQFRNEEIWHE